MSWIKPLMWFSKLTGISPPPAPRSFRNSKPRIKDFVSISNCRDWQIMGEQKHVWPAHDPTAGGHCDMVQYWLWLSDWKTTHLSKAGPLTVICEVICEQLTSDPNMSFLGKKVQFPFKSTLIITWRRVCSGTWSFLCHRQHKGPKHRSNWMKGNTSRYCNGTVKV